jgi:hypothetical protein
MPVLLRNDQDHAAWRKQVHSITRFGHQNAATLLSAWKKGTGGCSFLASPGLALPHVEHQNAQTPPSPRVGKGSWGDEG